MTFVENLLPFFHCGLGMGATRAWLNVFGLRIPLSSSTMQPSGLGRAADTAPSLARSSVRYSSRPCPSYQLEEWKMASLQKPSTWTGNSPRRHHGGMVSKGLTTTVEGCDTSPRLVVTEPSARSIPARRIPLWRVVGTAHTSRCQKSSRQEGLVVFDGVYNNSMVWSIVSIWVSGPMVFNVRLRHHARC